MSDIQFDYDELVQSALKGAIRKVLQHVADNGLPGEHHFYITFDTNADGVVLPPHLKERYTDDMTIVLQHRYWGLKVDEEYFELKLSFDGKPELLVIPFSSLIAFVDPSAQFALQFSSDLYPPEELAQDNIEDSADAGITTVPAPVPGKKPGEAAVLTARPKKAGAGSKAKSKAKTSAKDDAKNQRAESGNDNVVTLDTFRKNS